jgi:hypothetical protein
MDERDEPMRRRGGDNAGDYGYTVGQPPGYNTPPPSQQQWARPPAPPAKRKRTTPLWVTIVVGIAGLVIGTGIGGAGKNKTDTSATGTTSQTSAPAPTATSAPAVQPPTTTKPAAAAPADKGPTGDVVLGKMEVDAIGAVTVPVTITNHSTKTSNYIIEFEVDDATGTKIGDGLSSTNNLAPNQKAQVSGVALSVEGQAATLKLTKVTRYAS